MNTWLRLGLIVMAFGLSSVMPAKAQFSGGPYGPISKSYALPNAKTIYFVSPEGLSHASGLTLDEPTTLDSAISRVVTGDAIVLRGGTYRTGDLKLNQGITLQPYKDEKPILKGTQVASTWEKQQDNVWVTNWKTLFPSKPMFWWRQERHIDKTPLHRFNNDMVFIDGEFLQSAGNIDEITPNTFFIDYEKQLVYIGIDPDDKLIEITAYDTALLRTAKNVHNKQNDKVGPKIYGITFTQYAWRAIGIEGKRTFLPEDEPVDEPIGVADPSTYGKEVVNTLLENVTISYCSRVAGYFRGDGLVIRHSLISDTSTEGIYIIGSSDVLLEKNIIQRNDIENITGYYVSAVKIINQTHRVTVRDNLIINHPTSKGVWYDVGNREGLFINNYVENTQAGLFFEISDGITAVGNVFVNNDLGVWVLNSANVDIAHNTFLNSTLRFTRTARSATDDHFGWHPETGPDVFERDGHTVSNNLLTADAYHQGPLLSVDQEDSLCLQYETAQLAELNGNAYVKPENQQPLITLSTDKSEPCNYEIKTLEKLQGSTAEYEADGQLIYGDPRTVFLSPDLKRFELQRHIPKNVNIVLPEQVTSAFKNIGASPSASANQSR